MHWTIGLALGGNPVVPAVAVLVLGRLVMAKDNLYGTVLVDLERRVVIDLLPDRSAKTLAAWLKDHPTVAVVVRAGFDLQRCRILGHA